MRSCVLWVWDKILIFCSVPLSELDINFSLGLLQAKHLTNGDQWKDGQAAIKTHVFDSISIFSSGRRCARQGTVPTLCKSTAYVEQRTALFATIYNC